MPETTTTPQLTSNEHEERLKQAALTKHSLRALINSGNVDELERRILSLLGYQAGPTSELITGEFAKWWICFPCWKAYYVPTSGYFGPCPDCKRPTLRWPGDPNETLRMIELSVPEWLERRKTQRDQVEQKQ